MALYGLPRKDHAASGVRIRFVRRRLAASKRSDRIAAFLNAALETDGPTALQAAPGDIAKAAGSPKQEESPGREKRRMRDWLGRPPAFGRLSTSGPSRPPVFGRLSTSGLRPLVRAWRHHQGKKKGVSRISLAAHSRMAAGLQESPRKSPQFCRACVGRLGSDAHLRLAAAL